nr:hypothetical protein [Streptomyces sp. SID8014]
MFELMGHGQPVMLTSPMASVKKLANLACVAQQFGYEYVDVRQGGGRNTALHMYLAPDPSPAARQRAAANWQQYPQAAAGGPLPPCPADMFELLKARINFDLTGRMTETNRLVMAGLGLTIASGILALRDLPMGFVVGFWVLAMAALGISVVVQRKRNAKFAAYLERLGFQRVTDQEGRARYLPPGSQSGWGTPVQQAGGYAQPPQSAPAGYGHPQPGHQPAGYGHPQPGHQPAAPYGHPQPGQPGHPGHPGHPGPYGAPQQPGPHGAPQQQPGPYGPPQQAQPPQGQPPQGQWPQQPPRQPGPYGQQPQG